MKAGRHVDYSQEQDGSDMRWENPVEIPDPIPFGGTPEGFLAIMFPSLTGFEIIPEDGDVTSDPE